MLILGTLIVTWIAKNWWKILLLLIAVIILREYQVHKHRDGKKDIKSDEGSSDRKAADPLYIPPPFGRGIDRIIEETEDDAKETGAD